MEYVPAVVPPKHSQAAPHDDWVSAVQGLGSSTGGGDGSHVAGTAITGSYDGCLRVWDLTGGVFE